MNYKALAARVTAQFAKHGQTVTITRYSPTRNPATGVVAQGTPVHQEQVPALEVDSSRMPDELMLDPAVLVTKTARMFKLAPSLSFAPQPTDSLTLTEDGASVAWPIIGVAHTHPAGIPLVYTVGVAK